MGLNEGASPGQNQIFTDDGNAFRKVRREVPISFRGTVGCCVLPFAGMELTKTQSLVFGFFLEG